MHSKSLIEQATSVDYFLASCSYDELFTLSKTSTALKESIALHFKNPVYLFYRLNALLESHKSCDLLSFIVNFCHKDTACYKKMCYLANEEGDSEHHSFAFICYALITDNIANLDFKKFRTSLNFLTQKGAYTQYLVALRKTFNANLKYKKDKNEIALIEAKSSYSNFSGLNFSQFEVLSEVDFAGGKYSGVKLNSNRIVQCNFAHTNLSQAVFLVVGENCNFQSANFNGAIFIEMKNCSSENSFVTRLNELHHLLTTSKGIDSIKPAMIANICNTLNQIADEEKKEVLFSKLRAHPLANAHRNLFISGINFIPALLKGSNVFQTQSEKAIEQIKNAKPIMVIKPKPEMSISSVERDIEIKIESQKGILPTETFENMVSQMDRKSLLSLKSSCGFFNSHPVVKERLTAWNHFEVVPYQKGYWFLTSSGRQYYRLYSRHQIVEFFVDLKGADIIKQVFFSPLFQERNELRGDYYTCSIYCVTKSNKLFCIKDCSLDATPSEIALNLREGETIKIVVATKRGLAITTSCNRLIFCKGTTVEDKSNELDLSENEYVKQVETTHNHHIFVLTSKNRIFEYQDCNSLKKINYLDEFSEYRLLAGNNVLNVVIVVTKNNDIILRNTENNSLQKIDIPLEVNEVVSEFVLNDYHVVALTSAGRIFISDENYTFEEWNIQGLKGEQVKHIKGNSCSEYLILITATGRVVSANTYYHNDVNRKVDEVVLGEEDLLRSYEEQQFGLF